VTESRLQLRLLRPYVFVITAPQGSHTVQYYLKPNKWQMGGGYKKGACFFLEALSTPSIKVFKGSKCVITKWRAYLLFFVHFAKWAPPTLFGIKISIQIFRCIFWLIPVTCRTTIPYQSEDTLKTIGCSLTPP